MGMPKGVPLARVGKLRMYKREEELRQRTYPSMASARECRCASFYKVFVSTQPAGPLAARPTGKVRVLLPRPDIESTQALR